jgi:hypothetical protein
MKIAQDGILGKRPHPFFASGRDAANLSFRPTAFMKHPTFFNPFCRSFPSVTCIVPLLPISARAVSTALHSSAVPESSAANKATIHATQLGRHSRQAYEGWEMDKGSYLDLFGLNSIRRAAFGAEFVWLMPFGRKVFAKW